MAASASASDEQMLTYEEAAQVLGVRVNTIKQLVYRKVLFPERLTGRSQKYITQEQVNWYARRRDGEQTGPNPYVSARVASEADAMLKVTQPLQATTPSDVPQEYSGLALLLLVVVLLLAILANRQPDREKLEELRSAPQLQPVRRAILKLASEIAA